MPVTTPVDEPTAATDVLLLDHVPPVTGLLSVVVWPTHTVAAPVMVPGAVVMLTVVVAKHPVVDNV